MIAPPASFTGEMVIETSKRRPSRVMRTVSWLSMRSPARSRLRISFSSSYNSGGMMIVIGCPIASSAEYPNSRWAAAFHVEMTPFRVLEMMGSFDESTIAANQ
jgi:hypothetical protein